MHLDGLDLVLIVGCVAFAVSGFRGGLVSGLLAMAGFVVGGVVGARLAPWVAAHLPASWPASLVGVGCVLVAAMLGWTLAAWLGAAARRRLTWRPVRLLDSAGGAVLSTVAVLVVAWLVASPLATSSLGGVRRQVRDSQLLRTVDAVMPDAARGWLSSFRTFVADGKWPAVFGSIAGQSPVPVAPPDPGVAAQPAVAGARPSIVKILGAAPACSRSLEGSGFVVAADRVLTNAHVVAGVSDPQVLARGRSFAARVVLYDPKVDVAVLSVAGLGLPALALGPPLAGGSDAVVAGYPLDGPFTAGPARVRSREEIRGPDIYQSQQVSREVYVLYAKVRPGNSGGPLLTPGGQVAGVVFAAAQDDPTTGYALTAAQVSADARRGAAATTPVGTLGCN